MADLPLVGAQAVIAGMAAFSRDAAVVQSRLQAINRASGQLERETGGAFGTTGAAFSGMASQIATAGVIVSGALLAGGIASVKFAADFEQKMAVVKAISGGTEGQMAALSATITDLARHGTVGFGDLAEGATELVRSGRTIEDVMGGALKGVQELTIASGGEIGLKGAADLVAGSMNAFGIKAEDVARITSAASVVAQNSTATFSGFGQAVAIAGGSFHQAGFSLEDLAVAETIVTRDGTTASVAATALRGVIQKLILPSKASAEIMKKYGIHLFDATGKSVGFRAVVQQLNDAFSDQAVASGKLTEEERLQALATIGLQRTNAALFKLATEGADDIDDLYASFQRLKASDLAEEVMKPLAAQLQIAANNVLALALTFGNQFLPVLGAATRDLVEFLQNIDLTKVAAFGLSVAEAGTALVVAFISKIGDLVAFAQSLLAIGPIAEFVKGALIALGAVVATVLIAPFVAALVTYGAFLLALGAIALAIKTFGATIISVAGGFRDWIAQFGVAGSIFSGFISSLLNGLRAVIALLNGDFATAGQYASMAIGQFGENIKASVGAALQFIGEQLDRAGASLAGWAARAGPAGKMVSDALSGIHGLVESLAFLLQGNFTAAGKSAEDALKQLNSALDPIREGIRTVGEAFEKTGKLVEDRGVYKDLEAAWASLEVSGQKLQTAFDDVSRSAGDLAAPIRDLADKLGIVHKNIEPTGAAAEILSGIVKLLSLEISLAAAEFNAIATATANTAKFWGDAIRAGIDIVQVFTKMLGVSDDLQSAWKNLQNAGQQLGFAAQNIGLVLNDLLAPVGGVNAGLDLMRNISLFTGGAIGGVLALSIKAVSLLILGASKVILELTQTFTHLMEAVRQTQLSIASFKSGLEQTLPASGAAFVELGGVINGALNGIDAAMLWFAGELKRVLSQGIDQFVANAVIQFFELLARIGAVLGLIVGAVTVWGGDVAKAIASAAGPVVAAAVSLAQDIIRGLVGGLTAGAQQIASTAVNIVTGALNAARAAMGANSPSTEWEEFGVDQGRGLIQGFEKIKLPVRNAAVSLAEQALEAFRDTADKAEQLMADFNARAINIGQDVGRKINEAIVAAAKDIANAIDDAQSRIAEIGQNLEQSRSDRGRRDTLSDAQNAKREARRRAQEDADIAKGRRTEDLDKAKDHNRDLADADAQLQQDLADASNKAQRDAAQKKFDNKVEDINRAFLLDQADLVAKRAAEDLDRAESRKRQEDDAAFERNLAAETRALDDQLEKEANDRTIERINKERDERIKSINEALAEKEKQIREQGAREIDDLHLNVLRKIQILEDEFANKAVDILQKGGEAMRPLIEKIALALQGNFDTMRAHADSFTDSVNDAIGALNRLREAQERGPIGGNIEAPNEPGAGGLGPIRGPVPPEFATGGIVPGPWGRKMLAYVHGGEKISGLMGEAIDMLANPYAYAGIPGTSTVVNHNYNVNPTYEQYQSPANVELDMRALVAMARG